jgi:hypothetical protein
MPAMFVRKMAAISLLQPSSPGRSRAQESSFPQFRDGSFKTGSFTFSAPGAGLSLSMPFRNPFIIRQKNRYADCGQVVDWV